MDYLQVPRAALRLVMSTASRLFFGDRGVQSHPMVFCEDEPRPAVHLVGFLSQKEGGELRIFNAAGELIVTRHYEAVMPMSGAVGGLRGPSNLETGFR